MDFSSYSEKLRNKKGSQAEPFRFPPRKIIRSPKNALSHKGCYFISPSSRCFFFKTEILTNIGIPQNGKSSLFPRTDFDKFHEIEKSFEKLDYKIYGTLTLSSDEGGDGAIFGLGCSSFVPHYIWNIYGEKKKFGETWKPFGSAFVIEINTCARQYSTAQHFFGSVYLFIAATFFSV